MTFSRLVKIPVLGNILIILNSYAFCGDARSGEEFAGAKNWGKSFGIQFIVATSMAFLCHNVSYSDATLPGELIISIFPSLLGFGIGVYALIFSLKSTIIRELQKTFIDDLQPNPKPGSALILNAEMATPLLIALGTITIGILQKIFPYANSLSIISWTALWASIIFMIELIITLFGLGENAILKQLPEEKEE
ncbi:hypothetical protein [Salinicola sp. MIT1003]|uniref:hypothetical protein n=1 Tax=Salinicola sp. MIT1003 TaxID=1882734 RepID=UPI000AB96D15|nr:hypothetical protein [Salinicola sp. MIT1003]